MVCCAVIVSATRLEKKLKRQKEPERLGYGPDQGLGVVHVHSGAIKAPWAGEWLIEFLSLRYGEGSGRTDVAEPVEGVSVVQERGGGLEEGAVAMGTNGWTRGSCWNKMVRTRSQVGFKA